MLTSISPLGWLDAVGVFRGFTVSRQFLLDLLDGGEDRPQGGRQGAGQFEGRDFDGLLDASQGVFSKEPILHIAEDQADGRPIRRLAQLVIHQVEVEVHFSSIFGLEFPAFQFDDQEAVQANLMEEQVGVAVLTGH